MAGHGAAPKPIEQRRNRVAPARGEWVDLPGADGKVPSLPRRDPPWSERTRLAWSAWWRDPASSQWTAADFESVTVLAELVQASTVKHAAEIRLRMDGLGLTQKGKRDLRWRVVVDEEEAPAKPKASSSRRARLKVV